MITLAGAGLGNSELLTIEVKKKIESAKKIIAFGRIKESLKDIREDIIEVKRVDEVIDLLDDEDILILASGDPCFYGICDLLKRKGVEIDEILPGISSIQYLASKLQISFNDVKVKSFHGREIELDIKGEKYFFFTDKINSPLKISEYLNNKGLRGDLYIGYNLSYEDEEIIKIKIGEKFKERDKVSVVLAVFDDFKR